MWFGFWNWMDLREIEIEKKCECLILGSHVYAWAVWNGWCWKTKPSRMFWQIDAHKFNKFVGFVCQFPLFFFFHFHSFALFHTSHSISSSILLTIFTYRCVVRYGWRLLQSDWIRTFWFSFSIILVLLVLVTRSENPKRSHPILQYINPQLLVYFRFHVRINCAVQTVNCDRRHWYVLNQSRFITVNGNSSRWSQIISLCLFFSILDE